MLWRGIKAENLTDHYIIIVMESNNRKPIRIPIKKGQIITDAEKIWYCEADGNCTKIFLTDNTTMVATLCLCQIEYLLEDCNFYRCHKSYLVNCDKVQGFFSENNNRYARLSEVLTVPVSRDYYTKFKEYMMELYIS